MTDHKRDARACLQPAAECDVGNPVEWMVDPHHPDKILGVTYEFSHTGTRKTVWYTANKRRPKYFQAVAEMITD
jgi:hypothetical protein